MRMILYCQISIHQFYIFIIQIDILSLQQAAILERKKQSATAQKGLKIIAKLFGHKGQERIEQAPLAPCPFDKWLRFRCKQMCQHHLTYADTTAPRTHAAL